MLTKVKTKRNLRTRSFLITRSLLKARKVRVRDLREDHLESRTGQIRDRRLHEGIGLCSLN